MTDECAERPQRGVSRRGFVRTVGAAAVGLYAARGALQCARGQQDGRTEGGRTLTPIRQGFAWWAFARNVDPKELVKAAKDIGYASVDMPPADLYDVIREGGLVVSAIGGHGTLTDGLNRVENHDRIEGEILASLDVAVANEIPNLIVFSGNRAGISDEEGADNTVAGLLRVAKAAEERGVTLVLELLNSKVDHHDYQADHTVWGVEVVKRVDSPRVRLLDDLYHMQIMEGDLIRNVRDYHEYIAHYHTAGNPGRNDLDDQQEIYYPAVARAIAETGYQGYLVHEFGPKGEPIAALKAAYDVCNVV
jgi:hydroxypyruvate isomerase